MRILLAMAFLVPLGCTSSTSPPHDLSGAWAESVAVIGSGFGFTIEQAGDSIHGTGGYAIEAGPAGSFSIRGAYARPDIELVFTYDQSRGGLRQVFNGHIEKLGMAGLVVMVGIVTDSAGDSFSAIYSKR